VTADQFSYYLIDTSKLRELGYQDLQHLISQFPYCQNLHFLVAKKSHIEEHPDFDKWLNLAATYSTDRSYLYQLLHDVDFEKDYLFEEKFDLNDIAKPKEEVLAEVVSDEIFELPTLSAILLEQEKEEEKTQLIENQIVTPIAEIAPIAISDSANYDEDDDHYDEDAPLVTFADLMTQSEAEMPAPQAAKNTEEKSSSPKPLPKSSFSSWKKTNSTKGESANLINLVSEEEIASHKQRIEEKMGQEEEKKKKKNAKKKKNSDEITFADRSLIKNPELATVTLAQVLASQGRIQDSISMFEKLKLQIPEKSAFFAAEIEKLK
jgi:hypothetical protein